MISNRLLLKKLSEYKPELVNNGSKRPFCIHEQNKKGKQNLTR